MGNIKEVAIEAARKAGEVLMRHYGNVQVEFKGDGFDAVSMVTKADRESEETIVALIKASFPEHGIFGEENTSENLDAEYVWYVDPLDGTSNFTRNIPLFGVSIGVIKNGKPVCGVLYFPAVGLLLEAKQGQGAFANGKKITVSKRSLDQALYYPGGKYKSDYLNQVHPHIIAKCGLAKIIDASSWALAQIATGDAEIYFITSVPHDVVAGICIVKEAGGVVTDGKGEEWTLGAKDILVTTPTLQKQLLELIGQ